MELIVGIKTNNVSIREAEIGNDVLDVARQYFFKGLNIPMLSQWSSNFDGAKASHLDLVRM